jgi:hypothetical protein
MHSIERRGIRATGATARCVTTVGERLVDASNGHRDLRPPLATGTMEKKLRTKKNSLETEVSKLSF